MAKDDKEPTVGTPAAASPVQGVVTQDQFMSLMGALVDKIGSIGLSQESLKEILTEAGKTTAEVARKARWPENPEHDHISAYFSKDDHIKYGGIANKPKLARITYFCGMEEKEDRLTVGEILAYNAITTSTEVRGGAWRATVKKPSAMGGKQELWVWVPKETVDQRMVLPSLALILHELNGGESTQDVMQLLNQISALKAMVMELKGVSATDLEKQLLATP